MSEAKLRLLKVDGKRRRKEIYRAILDVPSIIDIHSVGEKVVVEITSAPDKKNKRSAQKRSAYRPTSDRPERDKQVFNLKRLARDEYNFTVDFSNQDALYSSLLDVLSRTDIEILKSICSYHARDSETMKEARQLTRKSDMANEIVSFFSEMPRKLVQLVEFISRRYKPTFQDICSALHMQK